MRLARFLFILFSGLTFAANAAAQAGPRPLTSVVGVQAIVNAILFEETASDVPHLDVTGDGQINVADIQLYVNVILAIPVTEIWVQHPDAGTLMQLNTPFQQQQFALTSLTPLDWTLESGSFPPGIAISNVGVVSGTPTATGTFMTLIRATSGVVLGERWITWSVEP